MHKKRLAVLYPRIRMHYYASTDTRSIWSFSYQDNKNQACGKGINGKDPSREDYQNGRISVGRITGRGKDELDDDGGEIALLVNPS